MAFDGTSKVIDARRQRQIEFKMLAGSQGHPPLDQISLQARIRNDLVPGLSRKGSLKPVRFPALISHYQMHGLPCLHIYPSR